MKYLEKDFKDTIPEMVNDVECAAGTAVPTDLCYTLNCPDVIIAVKKMGIKTSIRVTSLANSTLENELFLETRFNTICSEGVLEKLIIGMKLGFDKIYGDKYGH